MRMVKSNPANDFRAKAYAGTSSVLLAFDLDEARKPGLLGFAIHQKAGSQPWRWLFNSLTFAGKAHTFPQWNATPSNLAPIQKFRWGNYALERGTTCKYRVYPVYGTPGDPQLAEELAISVKTDDGKPRDHHVSFNRAVAASQAFSRQFDGIDKLLSENKNLPIEEWPEEPRKWLENGLLDHILAFIGRAVDDQWALDMAIYEYELGSIVQAVNVAHDQGVNLRVLYHSKTNDEQTIENEKHLTHLPASQKRARQTSRIFHDKFIILSKVSLDGTRTPQAVLCGSTNFTENGVYRQANVVHECTDRDVVDRYAALFDQVWANPDGIRTTKAWINANNPMDPNATTFVGFSPRSGRGDLATFVNEINAAQQDVLFATAFNLPADILNALLGAPHDDVLRFGLQNSRSSITGYHADRTAEFVTPALLSSGLDGWVKEGLKGQRGRLLVHTKAVVVNFTSDQPVIISGSHNLSVPASEGNDENYLILRGDRDLADRYGLEILRFYEHYRFRYYAKLLKAKAALPLVDDDRWADGYYLPGNLKMAARLRFAGG